MAIRRSAATLFPVLLSLLLAGGTTLAQDAARSAAPPKVAVGVVDFVKVFDSYSRYVKGQKQIDEVVNQTKAELAKMNSEIEEMKAGCDVLAKGSPQRQESELNLDLAMRRAKAFGDMWSNRLDQQFNDLVVQCYEDVDKAVQQVAKERGVGIVLRKHSETQSKDVRDRLAAYERRIVWYAVEDVDITADVIKLMAVSAGEADKPAAPAPAKDASTEGKK